MVRATGADSLVREVDQSTALATGVGGVDGDLDVFDLDGIASLVCDVDDLVVTTTGTSDVPDELAAGLGDDRRRFADLARKAEGDDRHRRGEHDDYRDQQDRRDDRRYPPFRGWNHLRGRRSCGFREKHSEPTVRRHVFSLLAVRSRVSVRRERMVLAGVVFAVLLAQVLLYPGVDTLVRALGAETDLDASMWFLAAEFAAFVAFAGVWGVLSDASGRRLPFIVGGAVTGGLLYGLLAWLPGVASVSFETILLVRALQGAATIAPFSLSMTMLMDLSGGHGRNMGAAGIAIGSGTALGAPLGGQLYGVAPTLPWRWPADSCSSSPLSPP